MAQLSQRQVTQVDQVEVVQLLTLVEQGILLLQHLAKVIMVETVVVVARQAILLEVVAVLVL